MPSYDTIIKAGTLLDGTGKEPVLSDIGINGNQISALGDLRGAKADRIIDAYGKYVTPGFIDITNHSDTHLTIFKYPGLESLVMQGITTIIGGNCGASLAPLGSKEAINAVQKWTDLSEINIDWAEMSEFLETMDRLRPEVNFGTLVGYGTVRRGVLGDEVRLLNDEEKQKIKLLIKKGLAGGAWGMSLGLAYGHERVSTTEEIIDICKILEGEGAIINLHLRSEGKDLIASVNEAISISRETGIPIHINHLKAIGKKSWPLLKKALTLIENAVNSGLDITFDVSPYNATGSPLYLLIPAWAREGGFVELFRRIDNTTEHQKIIDELKTYTLHYDKILVVAANVKSVVGKTVAEVATHAQLPPEEAMLELIRANEGRVTISGRTIHSKNMELASCSPHSFIASNGEGYSPEEAKTGNLVHPRSFGTFPHFWHYFVTDKKLLGPEKAIVKMTSGPAKKLGIKNRGVIAKDNFADITVLDPGLLRDRATYKNPYRYSDGINYVLVNGKIAVEEGKYIGARAGIVLRKS